MNPKNNPSKFLVVKGVAGLGNRLATLCCGIDYAKRTSRAIYVDWSDPMVSSQQRNVFYDFFSIQNFPTIEDPKQLLTQDPNEIYPILYQNRLLTSHNDLYWNCRHPKSSWIDRWIPYFPKGKMKMLRGYWRACPDPSHPFSLIYFLSGILDKNSMPLGEDLPYQITQKIVAFSDFIPKFSFQTFQQHLRLNPHFENEILTLEKNWISPGTVGIHVRRTDKTPKSINPLEKIITVLKHHQIENCPIFLATDSDQVFHSFQAKFPFVRLARPIRPQIREESFLTWIEKNPDENLRPVVLKEAIVDMWLLSKCEYLLYQSNSSFTLPTRALHNQPKNQINWDA